MINDEILKKIIEEYGTPTFLFDMDELKSRAGAINDILSKCCNAGRRIKLCYSIKANPFLIPYLDTEVDMFEVCSPGELQIIKALDIPGEKIIYSGVNKGVSDIKDAVNYGAGIITIESKRHFEIVREVSERINRNISVILRITSGNQFGMSVEEVKYILDNNLSDRIIIEGIHYFAGTQRNNPKPQEKEINKLKGIISELRESYNIPLTKLEYGPGLSYPYFEADDFTDTLLPLKNIAEMLGEVADDFDLTIEMGRFLASSCGYYLTSICDLKQSNDVNWCIIDGGLNHVNYYGQMMGMKRPVIRQLGSDDSEKESYCLCGSLCTSNDILVREMPLANPQIGDVLIFENLGAYSITEGINLFLSRDMAKVVAYENGEISQLRETINSWRINIGKFN